MSNLRDAAVKQSVELSRRAVDIVSATCRKQLEREMNSMSQEASKAARIRLVEQMEDADMGTQ